MIQPEQFTDSHQAFKDFCDFTRPMHFLSSRGLTPSVWPMVLCFAVLPVTIWIVHFFIPLPVVYAMTLSRSTLSVWTFYSFVGSIVWFFVFVFTYVLFSSQRIKKALLDKGIVVKGWDWFGPEVQLSMLQDFTGSLRDKGFLKPEALSQLIENTRDEEEARWREITVVVTIVLTLVTLIVAFIIGFGQPLLSWYIVENKPSDIGMLQAFLSFVTLIIYVPILIYLLYMSLSRDWKLFHIRYLDRRMKRAIYLHCLSNIGLSLLKKDKEEQTKPQILIDGPPSRIPKPACFSLFCEFRHPFSKAKPIHFSLFW